MSDGSYDLLLYQHRARCTLGAYSLAFISTGSRDVSRLRVCMCVCVCVCVFEWVSESRLQMHECEYVCICVVASACVLRDQIPKPLPGDSGARHFKGPRGSAMPARPPRWEILFIWQGLPWQDKWRTPEPGICTNRHHPCRLKSPTNAGSHNAAFIAKSIWFKEDNLCALISLISDPKLLNTKKKENGYGLF